jgi:hypothetical protein
MREGDAEPSLERLYEARERRLAALERKRAAVGNVGSLEEYHAAKYADARPTVQQTANMGHMAIKKRR